MGGIQNDKNVVCRPSYWNNEIKKTSDEPADFNEYGYVYERALKQLSCIKGA